MSVITPTLNEAKSLPSVLENLPLWVDEVPLVDGLSTDATEALARRNRPDAVVVHQHRRGMGAALPAGFAAATGDIIVMIDADGSTDPREMHQFSAALKDGSDFVKGSRHMKGGGSADFTFLRSAGNKCFVLMANILYGSRFSDLCYGYCAVWRSLEPERRPRQPAGLANDAWPGRPAPRYRLHFTLRKIYLPVGNTDRVPSDGERRWIDRRRFSHAASGYTWAKPHIDERRRTVGSVVAYRADHEQPPRQSAA